MENNHIKKDMFWNALGSLVYALSSMVLAFAVLRLSGPRDGGIFGFGFSTLGQQLFILAYFGIRPFHITDTRGEYAFGSYLDARRISCLCAVLGAVAFVSCMLLLGRYDVFKAGCLFLLCLYKILDGYADVYESELQRQGLLYRSGQSLCFRTILSASVLLLGIVLSHSLLWASAAAVLAQGIGTWAFAIRILQRDCFQNQIRRESHFLDQMPQEVCSPAQPSRMIRSLRPKSPGSRRAEAWRLLRSTGMLCLSVFLDFYVFSAAKYAVDAAMGSEVSGIFNVLFMPTSFIYLLSGFLIRPMLPRLAEALAQGEDGRQRFLSLGKRLLLSVSALAAVILAGTLLLGRFGLFVFEQILGGRYDGQITSQFLIFVLLILGGGFYALANVQYYLLVTLRSLRAIFWIYLSAALLSFCTAEFLVRRQGLFGGAVHYLAMMCLLFLLFSLAAQQSSRTPSFNR